MKEKELNIKNKIKKERDRGVTGPTK